ncbi:hypothetical protein POM88_022579 [Heracleum sosnowskyi]|uniref:tRNA(Ile)-lysidine/2-thiocytidine synthase N-terminal domain-containing protein n=1 Tax=Heracleum sosnowskyi TaxID=360622 RepID=A0AAD8MTT1_9APIA|nr:hypothetical protein POM88_022579 [Heracleum sosnowskyi]
MIVLGAFIAGARDLSFDSYGYGVVFLSNISTTIYLATISHLGKSSGLNSFGLMWCNGIMFAPLLFFWTLIRGDLEITMNFQYLLSPGFMVCAFQSLCSSSIVFWFFEICIRVDWANGKPKQGHMQEAARAVRYQQFQRICNQYQMNVLLVAHHADYQV